VNRRFKFSFIIEIASLRGSVYWLVGACAVVAEKPYPSGLFSLGGFGTAAAGSRDMLPQPRNHHGICVAAPAK
jgi:hypothetical protein